MLFRSGCLKNLISQIMIRNTDVILDLSFDLGCNKQHMKNGPQVCEGCSGDEHCVSEKSTDFRNRFSG